VPYLPGNANKDNKHYYQSGSIRLLTTREEEKKEDLFLFFVCNAGRLLLPGG
jgi:hypothetical protein